jgi:RNA-directed DNA polymerase
VKRYKGAKKAKKKCFSVRGWNFGFYLDGKMYRLKRHDETKVRKYIKIKAGASIYSGELLYFSNRLSYHNSRFKRLHRVLKKQGYKCAQCKRVFLPNDIIELHHVLLANKQRSDVIEFVHGHCHDEIHS